MYIIYIEICENISMDITYIQEVREFFYCNKRILEKQF